MQAETFDFIVVGSGSAGGVAAARLSEKGKRPAAAPLQLAKRELDLALTS